MKKSIFTIGIALLAFTNVALAESIDQSNENGTPNAAFHAPVGDVVLQHESPANANDERTIEETIAQDNQITESVIPDAAPICTRLTIEETITEDIKITESQIANEVYPLDFKRINTNPDFTKFRSNSQAVLFENN
ncbi:MAG TPA: hypothetical protein VK623_11775 [Flavobacterium sp.]|nr:hypothetical protein [Flavobacterium sp.]